LYAVGSSAIASYIVGLSAESIDLRFTGYQPYLADELGEEDIQREKRWRLTVQEPAPVDKTSNKNKPTKT
jgi:hypothetical protein